MSGRAHELKTWPGPFQAMADGRKTFEWRRDDRGYEVGDVLHLREWDPATEEYTGHELRRRVTYLLREGFGIPDGYVCMSVGKGQP